MRFDSGDPRDPIAAQAALSDAVAAHATDFDAIHAHIDWLHLPLLGRLGVPFVTTMHWRLDLGGLAEVAHRGTYLAFLGRLTEEKGPDEAEAIDRLDELDRRKVPRAPRSV